MSEILTTDQAAEILGLAPETLRIKARRKLIPHFKLGHRTLRFDRAEIVAWLEAQRVNAEVV